MQVANDDKEVFNGDLGRVRAVDAEAGELVVDFDGRAVAHPGPAPPGRDAPLAINGRSPMIEATFERTRRDRRASTLPLSAGHA
jgi:ATP-dependent exoDNAse (exonuclease V) alpha subunit